MRKLGLPFVMAWACLNAFADHTNEEHAKYLAQIYDAEVEEDNTTVQVEVTLHKPVESGDRVRIWYETYGGSRGTTEDVDYKVKEGWVTFYAGQDSRNISITVYEDNDYEPDSTFLVHLEQGVQGEEGDWEFLDNQARVTILNDDCKAIEIREKEAHPPDCRMAKVSVVNDGATVEEGEDLEFILSVERPVYGDILVAYEFGLGSLRSSEIHKCDFLPSLGDQDCGARDFSENTGEIVIPAGHRTGLIAIPTLDDKVHEKSTKPIAVAFSSDKVELLDTEGTWHLEDDDPCFRGEDPEDDGDCYYYPEAGAWYATTQENRIEGLDQIVNFEVALNGNPWSTFNGSLKVNWTLVEVTGFNGADYAVGSWEDPQWSGTISFRAGLAPKLRIRTRDQEGFQGDRTLILELETHPDNPDLRILKPGVIPFSREDRRDCNSPCIVEVTFRDKPVLEEVPDPVYPHLHVADAEAMEGEQASHFVAVMNPDVPVEGTVTFDWEVVAGTALTAFDFESNFGTTTLGVGAAEGFHTHIKVPLLHDSLVEGREYYHLFVSNLAFSSDSNIDGDHDTYARGEIIDEDSADEEMTTVADVSISPSTVSALEGESPEVTIEVVANCPATLTCPSEWAGGNNAPIDVSYSVLSGSGSATEGEDYLFASGVRSVYKDAKTFTVAPTYLGDDIHEGEEDFKVVARLVHYPARHEVARFVIEDEDDNRSERMSLSIEADQPSFRERDGYAKVTIEVKGNVPEWDNGKPVEVRVRARKSGSGKGFADFHDFNSNTISKNVSQAESTFSGTIRIYDDELEEPAEQFEIVAWFPDYRHIPEVSTSVYIDVSDIPVYTDATLEYEGETSSIEGESIEGRLKITGDPDEEYRIAFLTRESGYGEGYATAHEDWIVFDATKPKPGNTTEPVVLGAIIDNQVESEREVFEFTARFLDYDNEPLVQELTVIDRDIEGHVEAYPAIVASDSEAENVGDYPLAIRLAYPTSDRPDRFIKEWETDDPLVVVVEARVAGVGRQFASEDDFEASVQEIEIYKEDRFADHEVLVSIVDDTLEEQAERFEVEAWFRDYDTFSAYEDLWSPGNWYNKGLYTIEASDSGGEELPATTGGVLYTGEISHNEADVSPTFEFVVSNTGSNQFSEWANGEPVAVIVEVVRSPLEDPLLRANDVEDSFYAKDVVFEGFEILVPPPENSTDGSGFSSAEVQVQTFDDESYEKDEQYVLLVYFKEYNAITVRRPITILNDDLPGVGSTIIGKMSTDEITIYETGTGPAQLCVKINNGLFLNYEHNVVVTPHIGSTDTDASAADFAPNEPFTLTMSPSDTSPCHPIVPTNDSIAEKDESVTFTAAWEEFPDVQFLSSTKVTILDDDRTSPTWRGYVQLYLDDSSHPGGHGIGELPSVRNIPEAIGGLDLRVNLDPLGGADVRPWMLVSLKPDTAAHPDDVSGLLSVSVRPGEGSTHTGTALRNFFSIVDDTVMEGDETFSIVVDMTDYEFEDLEFPFRIVDNDVIHPQELVLQSYCVNENPDGSGAGTQTTQVAVGFEDPNYKASVDTDVDIVVSSSGTGAGHASAADIDFGPYSAVIEAGHNEGMFDFTVYNDGVYEGDEKFIWELSYGEYTNAAYEHDGCIVDDERNLHIKDLVIDSASQVNEGASLNVRVGYSDGSTQGQDALVELKSLDTGTADATAFRVGTWNMRIPANQSQSSAVSVATFGNDVHEGDKTFELQAKYTDFDNAPVSKTITIVDDDERRRHLGSSLSPQFDTSNSEGTDRWPIWYKLSPPVIQDEDLQVVVEARVSGTGDGYASADDFPAKTWNTKVKAGSVLTDTINDLLPVNDSVFEPDETFEIVAYYPDYDNVPVVTPVAILDDDEEPEEEEEEEEEDDSGLKGMACTTHNQQCAVGDVTTGRITEVRTNSTSDLVNVYFDYADGGNCCQRCADDDAYGTNVISDEFRLGKWGSGLANGFTSADVGSNLRFTQSVAALCLIDIGVDLDTFPYPGDIRTISMQDSAQGEEGTTLRVPVNVRPTVVERTSFGISAFDGTATRTDGDYGGIPSLLWLDPGQSSFNINVILGDDSEVEDDETFTLRATYVSNDSIKASTEITIVDNDGAAASAVARVDGPLLTLRYAEPLDAGSTPAPKDWVVAASSAAGTRTLAVTAVSVSGSEVALALWPPAAAGESVSVSYLPWAMHPLLLGPERVEAAPLTELAARNDTAPAGWLGALEEPPRPPDGALPAQGDPVLRLPAALGEEPPTRLDLRGLGLADVSALAGLAGLEALDLSDNRIADVWPLAGLAELRRLDLSGNRIADVSALAVLAKLEVLDLRGNAVADVWPLAGLAELRRLDLSGNRIADVSALAELAKLEVLDLRGNAVADVWPLAGLVGLRRLDLSGNRIGDASALGELGGLEVLVLDGNRVGDVLPLALLPRLARLDLAGNRVVDAAALAEPVTLMRLDLAGNRVVDASPLGDLSALVWLDLSGNPVSDVAPLGRLTALRWLWLDAGAAAGALAPLAERAPPVRMELRPSAGAAKGSTGNAPPRPNSR